MATIGWHLTKADDFLLHNAVLGKGRVISQSALAWATGNSGFKTEYQVLNKHQDKEAVWEQVRRRVAPNLPSRLGAFFMFECEQTAQTAQRGWFGSEDRILVRAKALAPFEAAVHRADATWLNEPEPRWTSAAEAYWEGEHTSTPLIEILVYGCVYFPDWQSPPFGLLWAVPGKAPAA